MEAIRLPYYGVEERSERSSLTLEIPNILFRWRELTGRRLEAEPLLAYAELWRQLGFRPGVIEISQTALGESFGKSEASARRWLAAIEAAGLGRRIKSKRGPRGGVGFAVFGAVEQGMRWQVIKPSGQLLFDFFDADFDGAGELPPELRYFDGTDDFKTVEIRHGCRDEGEKSQSEPESGDTERLSPPIADRHGVCENITNIQTNVSNIDPQFDASDEIAQREEPPAKWIVTAAPLSLSMDPNRAAEILTLAGRTTLRLHDPHGIYRWVAVGIQLMQSTGAFCCAGRAVRLSEYDIETCITSTNDAGAGGKYYCGAIRQRIKLSLKLPTEAVVQLPSLKDVRKVARNLGMGWPHKWMTSGFVSRRRDNGRNDQSNR